MAENAKIGICAAFKMGYKVLEFVIREAQFRPAVVFTSHRDDSEYEGMIFALCEYYNIPCERKVNVNKKEAHSTLDSYNLDLMILAWWPSIVKGEAISKTAKGWLNMHPSLLPFNRGKHPYYWSIVEGTPFGVTLHLIDEGVDTGPLLFQKEIAVEFEDTGETLYQKGLDTIYDLFVESFENIRALKLQPLPQTDAHATFRLSKELDPHTQIDLEKEYRAEDLINRLRGRTFLQGDSAFCVRNGKKYLLKIIIEPQD